MERSTQIPQICVDLRSTKKIIEKLLAIRDSVSQLNTFLPCLLNHSHNFKAGRVAAHFAAWKDNIMIM